MNDDRALLEAYARDKSSLIFTQIVHRHLAGVYSAALRRVGNDSNLAQDVAQEVFIALAIKAGKLARHPFLTGWLYIATRNEAAKKVRSEHRRKIRERTAMDLYDHEPSNQPDWSKVAPILDAVIDDLSHADRSVILLRYVDRRSFAHIGATLQTSEDAARMRNERALDKIRAALQQRGISSTAAALSFALADNIASATPPGLESAIAGMAVSSTGVPIATGMIAASLTGILLSPMTIVILLTGAAAGSAIFEFRQNQNAKAHLTAIQSQYAAATKAMRSEKLALASEKRTTNDKVASDARLPSEGHDAKAEGKAFAARHPEAQQALNDFTDAMNHARYGTLYRALNLTSQQIRAFESLIRTGGFSRSLQGGTIISMSSSNDTPPSERPTRLEALLGDEGYHEYMSFNGSLASRSTASDLASLLVGTDSPLSPGQAQQIAGIFLSAGDRKNPSQFDWDTALAKAQGVLSPNQLAMLQNMRIQSQTEHEMEEEVR